MGSAPELPVVAAIPVKPFDQAKRRLSAVLDEDERGRLGERLARHTVETVAAAGIAPLVLSADDHVTGWAHQTGVEVLLDEGSSLNRAAGTARDHILGQDLGWMVIHADLPVLSARDVRRAAEIIGDGRSVIAASSDGGTSMVGSRESVSFSYGAGSFHRHLAALATFDPVIVTGIGWELDLDTPADLWAARRHRLGAWLHTT